MGLRTGLDRCGKSRLHRDSIHGPSKPQAVAIPNTLPGSQQKKFCINFSSTGTSSCTFLQTQKKHSHCSYNVTNQHFGIHHRKSYVEKYFALHVSTGQYSYLQRRIAVLNFLTWVPLKCCYFRRLYRGKFYFALSYNVILTVQRFQHDFLMDVSCPTAVLTSGASYTNHCHVTQSKLVQRTNYISTSPISCNFC